MDFTGYQTGWCDDGAPLMKDTSCRRFEALLNGLNQPVEFTELRAFTLEHPTLSAERRAFYGRIIYVTARFSHGFTFDAATGVYSAPTP